MNFVLQTPSLKHLAGVKIVAAVWNQSWDLIGQKFQDVNKYVKLKDCSLSGNSTEWKAYEEKVESKVCALPLPQPLKQQLLNWVKPIGREIIIWHHYHSEKRSNFQCLDILLGNHLRWTMRGIIDYAKTAELMVKDERVDVERRYRIACLNCLEDEARELIQFIPENVRKEFMNKKKYTDGLGHHFLICYFTYTFIGKLNQLIKYLGLIPSATINTYLFCVTQSSGIRATCEYIFAKLNQREKEKVLNECEKQRLNRPCASLYYLSLMNKEQQERLFRESTGEVLECLLRWPAQSLFVEAVECASPVMPGLAYSSALSSIAWIIYFDFRDYDYSYLLWKIWRLTPTEQKRKFLENVAFIDCLLRTKREEFITLVLNEAPAPSILQLCERFDYNLRAAFMDESIIISDAALMECKQTAALISENEPEDEEKRLRSQHVSRFVDIIITRRIERGRF